MKKFLVFCILLTTISLACSSVQVTPATLPPMVSVSPTIFPVGIDTPTATSQPIRTPTNTQTPTPAEPPSEIAQLHWQQLARGRTFRPALINAVAADSTKIMAGTYDAGIYISYDTGKSWKPSNTGLGKGTVGSLIIDPENTDIVYAGLFDQGGVYKSVDGGKTWTDANNGIDLSYTSTLEFGVLVNLDPSNPRRVYYTVGGGNDTLFLSEDGGESWTVPCTDRCPSIIDLEIDPSDGRHLFAAEYSDTGGMAYILESDDGGATWQKIPIPENASDGPANAIAADPNDFRLLYAAVGWAVYRTADGGGKWSKVLDRGCTQLIVRPNGAPYCEMNLTVSLPSAITLLPDMHTMYMGLGANLLQSTNGGGTWSQLTAPGAAGGLRMTVDPRDGNRMFLTNIHTESWDFRSTDRGKTWQPTLYGVGEGWLTIDSAQNILYRPSGRGLLYRSYDNGATWKPFGTTDLGQRIRQIVPDPADATKLWAVEGCGTSPLLSTDNGMTFITMNTFPQSWLCLPYLMIDRTGQSVYIVHWGGFSFSNDGGMFWEESDGLRGIFRAGALDPSDPETVYIGSTFLGILKTTNGGIMWRGMNNNMNGRSVNAIAIHPENGQIVYIATDDGLYVSHNGGEWWWKIDNGYDGNPIVYSVTIDPSNPERVYAVTPDGVFEILDPAVDIAADLASLTSV
jgi:photosystem II stability/assembly factor-like uncharacterized protein